MFFDEVQLELEGGRGGDGFVSFVREKFIAEGPPDGGDGGRGGHVLMRVNPNLNTFRHFSGKKHFQGHPGVGGHKSNRHGKNGEALILEVPMGTLVYDAETNEKLYDFTEANSCLILAEGGRGGFGNAHFSTSVRQAPKFAEKGDIGERRQVRLELQMVADIGLLGFPSAGKSTLISHVSSAKPKIAAYPFTTIIPNLGVVSMAQFGGSAEESFVLADMPGIIEGASEGRGLGDQFLKHISRSASLIYVLDPFAYDGHSIEDQFKILQHELKNYRKDLSEKPFFVVINKIDAIPHEDRELFLAIFRESFPKQKVFLISGASGEGLKELMFEVWRSIAPLKKQKKQEEVFHAEQEEAADDYEWNSSVDGYQLVTLKPLEWEDEYHFEVEFHYEVNSEEFQEEIIHSIISDEAKPERGLYEVKGKRITQIVRMTDHKNEQAVNRVYDVLQKMNILRELHRAGARNGDIMKIDEFFFEYHDLS